MQLRFQPIQLEKRYPLRISRGLITGSRNLFVLAEQDACTGIGELAAETLPGGETAATGEAQLTRFVEARDLGSLSISQVAEAALAAGVGPRARAALDVALWDLFAKRCGQPLFSVFGLPKPTVATSVTVGIESPEAIRERVPEMLARTNARFLKVKLGAGAGIEADKAGFAAATAAASPFGVGLRVDANGGWSLSDAEHMLRWLAERDTDYVEQPLPPTADDALPALFARRPLPLFLDESCNVAADIPALADRCDGINVKLMKCGGLTAALRLVATARAHGLGTMIGCMGESHVAIAAGASIGALFDHIDLDSHLNLVDDPTDGTTMVEGVVTPRNVPGHGGRLREKPDSAAHTAEGRDETDADR